MIERPAWLEIDLSALVHNVRTISSIIGPKTKLCAVVKADAYGNGAVPIAREVLDAGASSLAVAIIQEGIELRQAGFSSPILILSPTNPEDLHAVVSYNLTTQVFTFEQAQLLSKAAIVDNTTVNVHLKIDTGLCRIGCSPDEAVSLAVRIAALPGLNLEGCFSHFAASDSEDLSFTRSQLESFIRTCDAIEAKGIHLDLRHIANSAAALDMTVSRLDMVRVGLALFGISPAPRIDPVAFGLKPVMTLKARVLYVKDVPADTPVGYGMSFITKRKSRIAILPIGYADGYPRSLSNRGRVRLFKRTAPIVGRICMDQCMIDVTDLPGIKEGDEATLFGGNGPPVEEVAALAGTISNELVSRMGKRLPRHYINGST